MAAVRSNMQPDRHHHKISYKLIVDPDLTPEAKQKIYRMDGVVDKNFRNQIYEDAGSVSDPRKPPGSRYWSAPSSKLLPTHFVIDVHYVGKPPEVEVLLENLNDNVNEGLIRELILKEKCGGRIVRLTIAQHPNTKKHLGFAHIEFSDQEAAKKCLETMNEKSVMGKIIRASKDPLKKRYKELIAEAVAAAEKPRVPAVPPPPPGARPSVPEPPKVPQTPQPETPSAISAQTPSSYGVPATPATVVHTPGSAFGDAGVSVQSPGMLPQSSGTAYRPRISMEFTAPRVQSPRVERPPQRALTLFERIEELKKQGAFGNQSDLDDEEKDADGQNDGSHPEDANSTMSPGSRGQNGMRGRWDQVPRTVGPHQTPPPPPGVVFLNGPPRQVPGQPVPPPYVPPADPKSNLLSNLFLLTGLYNVITAPEDLRAFYEMFFRPLINPHQVHQEARQVLKGDLKNVLARDMRRRVAADLAFKTVDAWWEKSQREYNEKMSIRNVPVASTAPHIIDITNTVDQILRGESSFARGYTAGLGLRSAMPKMPSFKRVKPPPEPADSENVDNTEQAPSSVETIKEEDKERSGTPEEPVSRKRPAKEKTPKKKPKIQHDEPITDDEVDMAKPSLLQRTSSVSSEIKTESEDSNLPDFRRDSQPAAGVPNSVLEAASLVPRVSPKKLETLSDDRTRSASPVPLPAALHRGPSVKIEPPTEPEVHAGSPEWNPFDLLIKASEMMEAKDRKEKTILGDQAQHAVRTRPPEIPPVPRLPPWKRIIFSALSDDQESRILNTVVEKGIDPEDVAHLKYVSDEMLSSENPSAWMNVFHWVDHPATLGVASRTMEEVSEGGCARCTPYKRATRRTLHLRKNASVDTTMGHVEQIERVSGPTPATFARVQSGMSDRGTGDDAARKAVALEIQEKSKVKGMSARQARLNKRRVMSDLDHTCAEWGVDLSDIGKFYSLKHASKRVKFGRSRIHNWGLFAQEPIAPDEMVIEYIGEKIRANIADLREKQYERVGIGSSYLFRVDDYSVIDATKTGNYARFMNHCCTPNSYAKVISVDGQKKIVIFSKQQINPGDEITYDYKFPIEENKIPCLCGSPGCRKSLN